jgi:predicted nucleic acid-binding protein
VTRTALDTSVIVAALLDWHAENDRASAAVSRTLADENGVLIPVSALFQAFSVMTRMPKGLRMHPADAVARLHDNFAARATLVAHDSTSAWTFLDLIVSRGVAGGGIHDADILLCAERAGATRLLTLNPVDFERFGPTGVEIVVP